MNHPTVSEGCLLVVDAQKGFTDLCPAELPVPGGLEIVPQINRLLGLGWRHVAASQDWHPPDHCSFFGQRENFYPPHCVMGTPGADFLPGLRTERFQTIWRKGFDPNADAYAVTAQHPGFVTFLRATGIRAVVVCGLAANICCFHTARDLRQQGFSVYLVEDASAGLDIAGGPPSQARAKAEGQRLGIRYLKTHEVCQNGPGFREADPEWIPRHSSLETS
jgi:nicotinamidase/pyrazinamidase